VHLTALWKKTRLGIAQVSQSADASFLALFLLEKFGFDCWKEISNRGNIIFGRLVCTFGFKKKERDNRS